VPERSPEIEEALRGWLDAKMRGDREEIVRMLSGDAGVLAVGTDAAEWLEGPEAFARAHGDAGPFEARIESLDAHRHRDVGWAAVRASVVRDGDEPLAVRLSVVLVQEDGEWRVVQTHASVGG
jgi:ketosteroid isomerase-like protein